jgi:Zn-dependent peptidase ImmA (M78 family)
MTWTEEHDLTLLAMRWNGKTNAEIAQKFNVSAKAVSERLRRIGLRAQTTKIERRTVVAVKPSTVETERDIRADRAKQREACQRHADAVMALGGFCAFSDSGDKRSPFGIARPLVYPNRRWAA